jgi:REP element-mobilizing transposase RayT
MPRTARASVGGICYHVINRGNARREVFLKDGDYHAFLKAMAHASIEVPMRVLGFCLLPNHFHLAVWPTEDHQRLGMTGLICPASRAIAKFSRARGRRFSFVSPMFA